MSESYGKWVDVFVQFSEEERRSLFRAMVKAFRSTHCEYAMSSNVLVFQEVVL